MQRGVLLAIGVWMTMTPVALAQSPYAATVVSFAPAPGQFVNDDLYNDPQVALGRPYGGGWQEPGVSSLVSLGGFGGSITLAFDHTVRDDPANPFGLDAIVYGNAYWVSMNPNRRWAECGHIEISRDVNDNGQADDPWYLIPGSHIDDPAEQWQVQGWDDDVADLTYPPEDAEWIPPGMTGFWTSGAYRLPPEVFETVIVANPNGTGPDVEDDGIWGYADYSPTLRLGDLDADNQVEDPDILPEYFYTRPDNPLEVGMTLGAGGGDAFDIAWAIDAATGQPANLDGFDFVRITVAVNLVILYPPPPLNELSTEIDAVVDVEDGQFGDAENDGDVDWDDFLLLSECFDGPAVAAATCPCSVMDFDQDHDVDLIDLAGFQIVFSGE